MSAGLTVCLGVISNKTATRRSKLVTDKIMILEAVIAAADEVVSRSRSGSSAESAFNRFSVLLENKLKEWREEEEEEEANYQELLREFGTNGQD